MLHWHAVRTQGAVYGTLASSDSTLHWLALSEDSELSNSIRPLLPRNPALPKAIWRDPFGLLLVRVKSQSCCLHHFWELLQTTGKLVNGLGWFLQTSVLFLAHSQLQRAAKTFNIAVGVMGRKKAVFRQKDFRIKAFLNLLQKKQQQSNFSVGRWLFVFQLVCNFINILNIRQEHWTASFFKELSILQSTLFFQQQITITEHPFLGYQRGSKSLQIRVKKQWYTWGKEPGFAFDTGFANPFAIFPPPQQNIYSSEYPRCHPPSGGHIHTASKAITVSWTFRKLLSLKQSLQHSCTSRPGCGLPPIQLQAGLCSWINYAQNMKENMLVVSINRLLKRALDVIIIFRV